MRMAPLVAGAFLLALTGCSTLSSTANTVGGWFGAGSRSAVKPNELPEIKPVMTLTPVWQG